MACETLTLDTLDRAWLEGKAAALAGEPLLLLQGYEWIGFARWRDRTFEFPPGVAFSWRFSEMWDLRLFSETGEWHCWKTGDGIWCARFANAGDWRDFELRDYVLWGRQAHRPNGSWTNIFEANGASIQVPFAVHDDLKDSPVRLSAWLAVDYDPATGQAHIADAMLRRLYQ